MPCKAAYNEAESCRVLNLLGVETHSGRDNSVTSESGEKNFWLSRTWGQEGVKETERDDAKKREGWNWRDRGALQLGQREGVGEHKVGGVAGGNGNSGSFSFVSRRNKGISDDKCQACTRSTGSASKESSRRVGIKEDVGRLGVHPLSYKELPVKNNTMLYALHRDRADRPDSANYRFLRGRSEAGRLRAFV